LFEANFALFAAKPGGKSRECCFVAHALLDLRAKQRKFLAQHQLSRESLSAYIGASAASGAGP
jgi:hypothetical protein